VIHRIYTPVEVPRSPVFWLLYIMFVMVSGSGLMATTQIAPIAKDFGAVDTVILFGATTITIALIVDMQRRRPSAVRPDIGQYRS
jgi:OFA family oxalate/formate antiporter-like MFS transporter